MSCKNSPSPFLAKMFYKVTEPFFNLLCLFSINVSYFLVYLNVSAFCVSLFLRYRSK